MKEKKYISWEKDELIKEILSLSKRKSYGLVWENQNEFEDKKSASSFPIIEEDKSKAISNDEEEPNIIVEGDNLHSLKLLNFTHKGKIDFIFIDPPYNTGNDTWKYNNKFVNDDDSFKHSKFCSFFYKRLLLAKSLLKNKGILCCSIDNYEVHNVRHILEEIFIDKEIITTVVEHNLRGRPGNNFSMTHEYYLWVVNKGEDLITRSEFMPTDIRRNLRRTGLDARREDVPSMFYGIEIDKSTLEIISTTKSIPIGESLPKTKSNKTEYVFPVRSDGNDMRWYYSQDRVMKEAKEGFVYAKKINNKVEIHYHQKAKPMRRKSVLRGAKYDSSTYGTELLTSIIGDNNFPFPKSIFSIIDAIKSATNNKDAIILDFFAGSGTTGHAVLELNKIDNGNRKFILCTNNENNIAREITYKRIEAIIKGYKSKKNKRVQLYEKELQLSDLRKYENIQKEIEEIKKKSNFDEFNEDFSFGNLILWGIEKSKKKIEGLGGNLKYYKVELLENEITDKNRVKISKNLIDSICLKEATHNLIKQDEDLIIFQGNDKNTAIIFNILNITKILDEIKSLKNETNLYVFSLTEDNYDDEFENLDNIKNIFAFPDPYIKILTRLNRSVSA